MDDDDEDNFDEKDYEEEEQEHEEQDEYQEREQEFKEERAAFERVGDRKNLLGANIIEGIKQKSYTLSSEDQFKIKVNELLSLDYFKTTNKDIDNILELIYVIPHIKYKNSFGFLAGYETTRSGKIDIDIMKKLSKKDEAQEYGITLPDILRYARLIQKYK